MKNFKFLFIVVLFCLLIIPFSVFADEKGEGSTDNREVIIYLFRGETCSHCAEFEAWIKEIEPEYGDLFKVVDYEVWNNEENAELMSKVAKNRGDDVEGVPYILVGNKAWKGFSEDDKEEIIEEIKSLYEVDPKDRYDAIALLPKEKKSGSSNDIIALIIVLLTAGLIVFGIKKARETVY